MAALLLIYLQKRFKAVKRRGVTAVFLRCEVDVRVFDTASCALDRAVNSNLAVIAFFEGLYFAAQLLVI